jgi:hypothetical protein
MHIPIGILPLHQTYDLTSSTSPSLGLQALPRADTSQDWSAHQRSLKLRLRTDQQDRFELRSQLGQADRPMRDGDIPSTAYKSRETRFRDRQSSMPSARHESHQTSWRSSRKPIHNFNQAAFARRPQTIKILVTLSTHQQLSNCRAQPSPMLQVCTEFAGLRTFPCIEQGN